MKPDFIDTNEAAKILKVSPRRVQALKERLKAIELGGSLVFSRQTVEAYKKALPPGHKKGGRPKKNPE